MKCDFIKEVLLNIKKYAFYQESKFLPTCSATKQNKADIKNGSYR